MLGRATLSHVGSNVWIIDGVMMFPTATSDYQRVFTGSIDLSANPLTAVRIGIISAARTFTAGTVKCTYF